MTELLRAEALCVGYGGKALAEAIDFRLAAGETVAVLGPNGSGKSTLFRTLIGALAPVSGEVSWRGRQLAGLSPHERAAEVAWVPQQPTAAFDLGVADYVMLGRLGMLPLGAAPGLRDRQTVASALARLGLSGFAERLLGRMSGGERQLAAIAKGLAQQAAVLILDEPAASLDFANQGRVLDMLSALAGEGLGILYSTHDPNHALRTGGRVLLFACDGRLRFGEAADLLEPAVLSRAYGVPIEQARTTSGQTFLVLQASDFRVTRSRTVHDDAVGGMLSKT